MSARMNDPVTSHVAGLDKRNVAGLVLAELGKRKNGLPDHRLVEFVCRRSRVTPQRVRTVRAELVAQGLVRDTGRRELTPTGHRANVWAVV